MEKEGILLESGTNEVELLEFLIAGQGFGVNVVKTQAIEQYNPSHLTTIPMAPPSLMGMLLFRNRTIPLIDLGSALGIASGGGQAWDMSDDSGSLEVEEKRIVLVMEFNNVTSAVLVDGVNRIHRISWESISPMNSALSADTSSFTGSVNIEGREILIVDMERVIGEVMPTACMEDIDPDAVPESQSLQRGDIRIVLAEDSNSIRSMIEGVLAKGGYTRVTSFDNGKSAHDYVESTLSELEDGETLVGRIDMIISDIEMPQMDGLTFCKRVKRKMGLADLPVVLFSSLINEQMAAKCRTVQADGYISKPQIGELIELVDRLCLDVEAAAE